MLEALEVGVLGSWGFGFRGLLGTEDQGLDDYGGLWWLGRNFAGIQILSFGLSVLQHVLADLRV